ncbi:MAG TPA: hypothetical protein VG166_09925 [Caulobacteraceae bacterium]|jgi:hypothetical protein|nr:hypothetical protein [Caulobacteraceae bacterium]
MKALLALAACALAVAPAATLPALAAARVYHAYGRFDPCVAAKTRAANNGAMTGAVLGAVVGGAMAGSHSHLQAAAAGGATGAEAGQSVGAHSVKCLAYPRRYRARPACRWIEDDSDGAPHQFELCRGADGIWRPSGRGA